MHCSCAPLLDEDQGCLSIKTLTGVWEDKLRSLMLTHTACRQEQEVLLGDIEAACLPPDDVSPPDSGPTCFALGFSCGFDVKEVHAAGHHPHAVPVASVRGRAVRLLQPHLAIPVHVLEISTGVHYSATNFVEALHILCNSVGLFIPTN